MSNEEVAICRGCKKVLKGKPYYMGGSAYHPRTNERCKVNFYGGFVCSDECDKRANYELERSMPGNVMPPYHLYTNTKKAQ
jgi:hypothetical protein